MHVSCACPVVTWVQRSLGRPPALGQRSSPIVPSADWTFGRDAVGDSSICDDDRSEHGEENEDCSLLAAPGFAAEGRGAAMLFGRANARREDFRQGENIGLENRQTPIRAHGNGSPRQYPVSMIIRPVRPARRSAIRTRKSAASSFRPTVRFSACV